jgi:hypothetical protein
VLLSTIIYLRIQRKFKLLMLLLLALATLLAFWFAVSVYGYTSNNAVNLFITLCFQFFFSFAPGPLYYEAAVEVTYPVPEGTDVPDNGIKDIYYIAPFYSHAMAMHCIRPYLISQAVGYLLNNYYTDTSDLVHDFSAIHAINTPCKFQ